MSYSVGEGCYRGVDFCKSCYGVQVTAEKSKRMQVLTHEEMQRFLIQAKENDFYELALLEWATLCIGAKSVP